jgi:glutathione S-transferase
MTDTNRVFAVLEDRLKDPESKGWLALGRMTLADLANFSWVAAGKIIGERLDVTMMRSCTSAIDR